MENIDFIHQKKKNEILGLLNNLNKDNNRVSPNKEVPKVENESIEVLPSIYNQLMGGLPVIDNEKGEKDKRNISFQSVDGRKQMAFGNLTDSQLNLIKNMKNFVDSRYFSINEDEENVKTM